MDRAQALADGGDRRTGRRRDLLQRRVVLVTQSQDALLWRREGADRLGKRAVAPGRELLDRRFLEALDCLLDFVDCGERGELLQAAKPGAPHEPLGVGRKA